MSNERLMMKRLMKIVLLILNLVAVDSVQAGAFKFKVQVVNKDNKEIEAFDIDWTTEKEFTAESIKVEIKKKMEERTGMIFPVCEQQVAFQNNNGKWLIPVTWGDENADLRPQWFDFKEFPAEMRVRVFQAGIDYPTKVTVVTADLQKRINIPLFFKGFPGGEEVYTLHFGFASSSRPVTGFIGNKPGFEPEAMSNFLVRLKQALKYDVIDLDLFFAPPLLLTLPFPLIFLAAPCANLNGPNMMSTL